MNTKAFTLPEVLVATALSVMLAAIVANFYAASGQVYSAGMAGQSLQDGANVLLAKITAGAAEPTGTYRLSTGVSYTIPAINELRYRGVDGIERWYKPNASGTAVIYHHPTAAGVVDETIYAVPTGATLTLRFWIPAVANNAAACVGMDAALTQTVQGKVVTGSATTLVTLRSHP